MSEDVTISLQEYQNLVERDIILSHLEGLGVDNWQGYSLPYCWECGEIKTDSEDVDRPGSSWDQCVMCSDCLGNPESEYNKQKAK